MSGWNKKDVAAPLDTNQHPSPMFLDYGMNNSTYPANSGIRLVNADRIANSAAIGEAVVHQGWVQVKPGKGSITGITVTNIDPTKTYVSDTFVFTGANTDPAAATFDGGVGVGTVKLNSGGAGYDDSVTVTLSAATGTNPNNDVLTFAVTGSGRFGRNQVETIVALSEPTVTNLNVSGKPYFKDTV